MTLGGTKDPCEEQAKHCLAGFAIKRCMGKAGGG